MPDPPERQLAVDEQPDEDGVEDGDHGGLGRREEPPVDAAEDDDRSHERPKPVLERLEQRVPRAALEIFRHGHVPAEEEVHGGEPHRDHDAGHYPGEEHFGDGLLPRHRIDDHRDARGDDDAHAPGGRRGRSRIALAESPPDHGRDHKHPHGGGRRGAGTGNRPEKHAGQCGGDGEPAGDGADDVFRDGDKPARNARAFHERPDEHEGGQGHDGKGIDRGEGDLHQRDEVLVHRVEGGHGRHAERHGNGGPEQHQHRKGGKEDSRRAHGFPPSAKAFRLSSASILSGAVSSFFRTNFITLT